MNLIKELKRRKVIKTLGVYAGIVFVFVQLAADVFPYLYLPDWTVTVVVILSILGFPITFFLSWTYDVTRQGIIKDNADNTLEKEDKSRWFYTKKIILPVTGFILTLVGGVFWFIYPFLALTIAEERNYDASIAVLYMDNISSNEQSYFADGLTTELINRLSRIQNLKVAPRIDVAVYKNKAVRLNEIADQLNVDYIVDGSVKIINNNLRVNVSLFDIKIDKAIWTEEYNNELTYILEVQDEIAGKIVNKLNDKLNIEKSDLLAAEKRSTKNLEAYNLVQKGFKFLNEPFTLNKMGEAMDPLAESALKLDPKYSDAYALSTLAKVFKWMYKKRPEGVEFIKEEVEDRERALLHMDKAIQYDNKSRIAKALKIFIQQWNVKEISKANQMFTARSMMIDANMLLNEFPDDLFCQTLYWYFHLLRNNVSGSGPESYRETLSGFLASYHKLEKNKFNYNEPTEVLISFIVWENIPKLYGMLEEYDNLVDFLMLNKNNFCKDGTYGCLNTFVLGLIAEGFYTGYEYDSALEITNSIISMSQDELISLGFSVGDKKRSYYKFGMMNLKSGNYSNAINGFNEALKLSLAGAKITCDECEFNFSEKDEFNKSDEWWHAHYYRRLGLAYYLNGEYSKSLKKYSESLKLNEVIEDNDKTITKCICSEGYIQELIGNRAESKIKMDICSNWIDQNFDNIINDYDAFELLWPLYKYYNKLNDIENANKYLKLAYDHIDSDLKNEYNKNSKGREKSKYFYSKVFFDAIYLN